MDFVSLARLQLLRHQPAHQPGRVPYFVPAGHRRPDLADRLHHHR
jgi:hypothetical protein